MIQKILESESYSNSALRMKLQSWEEQISRTGVFVSILILCFVILQAQYTKVIRNDYEMYLKQKE